MTDLRTARAAGVRLLSSLRRYQLIFACVAVMLCFVLCNDVYGATRAEQKARNVINGKRRERVIDYSEVVKRRALDQAFRSEQAPRFLVEPNGNRTLLAQLAADTCGVTSSSIISIPFTDSTSTTAGAADNYNLVGGQILANGSNGSCPSPQCEAYTGSLADNFTDRGYSYSGTGSGPDVAYQISFLQPTNFTLTLDPTDVENPNTPCDPSQFNPQISPNYTGCEADDMALLLYGSVCSNNLSDVIVLADNYAGGEAANGLDNVETLTVTSAPAGTYNIVIDGYSYAGTPAPSAGPFTLSISCAPNQTCPQPGAFRRSRR